MKEQTVRTPAALRPLLRFLAGSRDRSLLVIDDDLTTRLAIELVLEEHEFGPIWLAADVETALQQAHQNRPSYIVTDRLFGSEKNPGPIAFLRHLLPDTRIVVFSGIAGRPEWADAAVVKPELEELARTLGRL